MSKPRPDAASGATAMINSKNITMTTKKSSPTDTDTSTYCPTLMDEHLQTIVDQKMSFIPWVMNERAPGLRDLGRCAGSFRQHLEAVRANWWALICMRAEARKALNGYARGEAPADLVAYEEGLSTFEVVLSDLLSAVAAKHRVLGFCVEAGNEGELALAPAALKAKNQPSQPTDA